MGREVIFIDDTEQNADWLKPAGKKSRAKAEKELARKTKKPVKEAVAHAKNGEPIRRRTKREKE